MATAERVPVGGYNVVLTLSEVEARYLSVLAGRTCGTRPVNGIWTALSKAVGEPSNLLAEPKFDYESLSMATRDWVEDGE